MAEDLIHCGRVLKPHGLKGELGTIWFADSPLLLSGLPRLFLGFPGSKPKMFNIVSWRKHKDKYLIILDKIQGRDSAQTWQGADIFLKRKYIPELDEDETYLFEILGCRVYLPDMAYLGIVDEFLDHNGSEVWRIMTEAGQEVLFPVNEVFIKSIDAENKKIIIDPPEGLLELYGIEI
ncbi:MAG: 16S rRNA processing protein RimM [Desulfonatronovibrio sp. MSAO_Bac4]|nr:MAG: 16S rRNA processing protein RimM [Desulfonatronovibrio sp. MSAO_Bac4]